VIGSVKEIVALSLILTMGALALAHRRWLWKGARAAIPFALVVAAGVAALGVAFGAWALIATVVLVTVGIADIVQSKRGKAEWAQNTPVGGDRIAGDSVRKQPPRGTPSAWSLAGLIAAGVLVVLVGAWPTFINLSGSLHVAQAIASTSNPGNLHSPLHPSQMLGIWLGGSYKLLPTGFALTLTSVLAALVLLMALVGLGYVVRSGWYPLAGWFALTIVLWLLLSTYATTWADAKTLMLTSPVVVLMAWAGVAALRVSPLWMAASLVAFLLVGGVLVSDALQYHESNLAPTARYDELASINEQFAGLGPTLFTDFDEYALYELRAMDVGGPDFAYPPPALAGAAAGYGRPVMLNRIAPAALVAYPLIVTRRDPSATRPPAAYRLVWQGTYYQVWKRAPHARTALVHLALSGSARAQCAQTIGLSARARSHRGGSKRGRSRLGAASARRPSAARLVAALAPEIVPVTLPRSRFKRPVGWTRVRQGISMRRPGSLHIAFVLPRGGAWLLWVKGDVMRPLRISIDGRQIGSLGAQLGGNSLVANTLTPLRATLAAGLHTLTIDSPDASLAPGDGGAALLNRIFLSPAGYAGEPRLVAVPAVSARSLCGRRLQWIELVSG